MRLNHERAKWRGAPVRQKERDGTSIEHELALVMPSRRVASQTAAAASWSSPNAATKQ